MSPPRLNGLQPLVGIGPMPPLLGRISAGFPLEAIDDQQRDRLQSLLACPGRYALQVGDDAMAKAGICSGDIVILQSRQRVCNGDVVVVLIDGEPLCLRRFRQLENGQIRLYCVDANRDGQDYAAERVAIQGTLVGQLRQYR